MPNLADVSIVGYLSSAAALLLAGLPVDLALDDWNGLKEKRSIWLQLGYGALLWVVALAVIAFTPLKELDDVAWLADNGIGVPALASGLAIAVSFGPLILIAALARLFEAGSTIRRRQKQLEDGPWED